MIHIYISRLRIKQTALYYVVGLIQLVEGLKKRKEKKTDLPKEEEISLADHLWVQTNSSRISILPADPVDFGVTILHYVQVHAHADTQIYWFCFSREP